MQLYFIKLEEVRMYINTSFIVLRADVGIPPTFYKPVKFSQPPLSLDQVSARVRAMTQNLLIRQIII